MTKPKTPTASLPLWRYWRGLSGWNFYFLVKFALLWGGYLNFHPMLNLVFLAFLLVPIPQYKLHRIRHWIAIPLGFMLAARPGKHCQPGLADCRLQRRLYLGSGDPLY